MDHEEEEEKLNFIDVLILLIFGFISGHIIIECMKYIGVI